MGIIGTFLAYQAGKRSANRKRGRDERRAEFLQEWREVTNIENYVERGDDDCDCQH